MGNGRGKRSHKGTNPRHWWRVQMPGEGSNRGLRHGDVTDVPSSPAIRQLTVQEAQAGPRDPPEVSPAAPHDTPRPRNPAQEHWPRCFQSSNIRKIIFVWRGGKHHIHLSFYCWFWILLPSARAGRWAQVGKQGCTFNGAPLGLPPKDSSSIHLVLLVTAHHCKRDHFLWREKNKVVISS